MAKPSKKLEQLALQALRLKMKADEITAQAKEANAAFIKQLIAEDLFDQSTKAIGDVRTVFSPNRYFDLDTALSLVDEEAIKESTVEVVDAKLLKQHMTPIQVEKSMKDYDQPLKLGLRPNE